MRHHCLALGAILSLAACRRTADARVSVTDSVHRADALSNATPLGLGATADSATRAVQAFYDWYLGLSNNSATDRFRYDSLLANTHSWFSPALVAALRNDLEVQRHDTSGDIVSITADYDPFLNSQDPCERYEARGATTTRGGYAVAVYGICSGGISSETATIIAEVTRAGGGWQLVDFRTPGDPKSDLRAELQATRPGTTAPRAASDSARRPR